MLQVENSNPLPFCMTESAELSWRLRSFAFYQKDVISMKKLVLLVLCVAVSIFRVGAHTVDPFVGITPLMYAAGCGHVPVVEQFLANGADVQAADERGWTGLMYAAAEGQLSVVQALIKAKAGIDAANERGETPLLLAVRGNHLEVVQELVAAHADVNAKDSGGNTALMLAADRGYADVVKVLLAHGALIDQRDYWSFNTALMFAVEQGHGEVVEILLQSPKMDLDVLNKLNNKGESALFLAEKFKWDAIVKSLVEKGADSQAGKEERLAFLAKLEHEAKNLPLLKPRSHGGFWLDVVLWSNGFLDKAARCVRRCQRDS
jgi:ankyrin repeat protein